MTTIAKLFLAMAAMLAIAGCSGSGSNANAPAQPQPSDQQPAAAQATQHPLLGKWAVHRMMSATSQGIDFHTLAELKEFAEDFDDDYNDLFACIYDFRSDGFAYCLMPVTSEQKRNEAAAEGLDIEGSNIVIEKNAWKQEGDKYMLDSGSTRVVLGDTLSPWDEIKINGDMIELPMVELKRM